MALAWSIPLAASESPDLPDARQSACDLDPVLAIGVHGP